MNLLTFSLVVIVGLLLLRYVLRALARAEASTVLSPSAPPKPVSMPANFFGGPAHGYVTPVPTDPHQDYVVVPYIPDEAVSPTEPNLAYYTASSPVDEADGTLPFIYVRDITARELTELQSFGKTPNIQGE